MRPHGIDWLLARTYDAQIDFQILNRDESGKEEYAFLGAAAYPGRRLSSTTSLQMTAPPTTLPRCFFLKKKGLNFTKNSITTTKGNTGLVVTRIFLKIMA